MAEVSNSDPAIVSPWLTIIGIGEDGVAGLGDEAKRLIAAAPVVYGGARHMELTHSLIKGEGRVWQSPFGRSVEEIVARRGSPVVVLASGDPFFFGVGATLARRVAAPEIRTLPAPSSFSLAASRLGWALQEATLVSLHGRPIDLVRPHLQPGNRVLALTSDGAGPKALAELLATSGFGQSRLTVLEALGGAGERVTTQIASRFMLGLVHPLNVCAIEVAADQGGRVLPLSAGRDDTLFEHDGQITKREVRALTLSALAPRKGELLWDIGAGSGSIGIEWMLADPAMRAIAIEASPERAARVGRNAEAFGVPGLTVVEGKAPAALSGLSRPDAIFIGGGGSEPGVMDAAVAALGSGGRLVANAVTTEMEAVLLQRHARLGGSLIRIDIARASPVGGMTGWRPAMPVTQWSWTKA
ncbi:MULTISPECIES: precorrin-6y C5,15-methyltransferase (decarboxylating) subunit CbiE [Ensifer]|jgi:precorrin-6B C5,15-methyltransferase / cobalt-precorrin-6B C5,C15-methyltransferase|uniref:Precorrin-6y C5,15-methyltransferase (Decarboxylating) subunit CbiE n=1 Tax=Ensifer canadensis TaxID=555315 RepID=A0AAW4FTS4_9HYPH|nr:MULTISPECIES: precorrin-6y C5,15-methyltransferase (decarboxylating) subunit CbiE [Ensifer]MBM3094749.1 precorrin-6y C5,15-methyltransferase (decarboxylating) subunit CbiE [Ensifer canadensis]MDP9631420.1 precorrin-6Y C5,15-methyltransferase (decarboxylating) [Ensifer adhaerens]NOV21435.1 precorrin-6y C5,15-methyltransferase (decarboxylating) subunit CbiE [Ensifer canadensis]PSS60204.1 cobalamin biosynthesis bifunctional protein CbiET [Ensifer sp. NM-2]